MERLKSNNYQNFMIFFTVFLFWISIQFEEVVEDFLAYILVISIGIIHGANDLLILSIKDKKKKSFIKNLLAYICIIISCVLIYVFSPFSAIILFVLLSAYHFGEEHLSHKIMMNAVFNSIYYMAYGLFIFSLLFYQSLSDVDKIMVELTNSSFTKIQVEITLIVSTILLLLGSFYLVAIKKRDLKMYLQEMFYLVLLFFVFSTSSLILGFAIYFIFWHSIPSIIHQVEFISGNLNKKNILFYVKKAMVYWGISIFGLVLLYQLVPQVDLFATLVFVILFAVTAPHTWVMHKMKN